MLNDNFDTSVKNRLLTGDEGLYVIRLIYDNPLFNKSILIEGTEEAIQEYLISLEDPDIIRKYYYELCDILDDYFGEKELEVINMK